MAAVLHSTDVSADELKHSLSESGEISTESPSLTAKQRSSNVPEDVVTDHACDNFEHNGKHSVIIFGQDEDTSNSYDVVLETQEAVKKHESEVQVKCSEKCQLKIIQVIDETTLVDLHPVASGASNNDSITGNRKEKKSRRRGGKYSKNKNALLNFHYALERKEKKGLVYSRKEMEAMRFKELEEQKKKWFEVYCGLGPLVVREYDGLAKCEDNHNPEHVVNFDPRSQFPKASNFGENCSKSTGSHVENMDNDEICSGTLDGECSQDEDSDDDYSSIQKPAFVVKGEPDFDSGPPQDGLEFLRRVRWEAAQIPKVKVGKVGKIKEQKPYMPQIPDILECPENLLPLKEWEDSFIADFSELRLGFSQLELQGSSTNSAINLQSSHEEANVGQMFENVISENFDSITSTKNSCPPEASCTIETSVTVNSNSPENCSDNPTLSVILKMDSAARTSMLKKRISSMENMTTFPRNDCLWLFALCVVVDSPLDADTCAALRSLLRKCASLRAAKTELDEELVILNILATISGKYFGQSDK